MFFKEEVCASSRETHVILEGVVKEDTLNRHREAFERTNQYFSHMLGQVRSSSSAHLSQFSPEWPNLIPIMFHLSIDPITQPRNDCLPDFPEKPLPNCLDVVRMAI